MPLDRERLQQARDRLGRDGRGLLRSPAEPLLCVDVYLPTGQGGEAAAGASLGARTTLSPANPHP